MLQINRWGWLGCSRPLVAIQLGQHLNCDYVKRKWNPGLFTMFS